MRQATAAATGLITVTGDVVATIPLGVEAGQLSLPPDGSHVHVAGSHTGRAEARRRSTRGFR